MTTIDRLSFASRWVLWHSQRAAEFLLNSEITPYHVLIGCTLLEEGAAYQWLGQLGITLDGLIEYAEIGKSKLTELRLAEGCQQMLDKAADEARNFGFPFITTTGLLLGIMQVRELGFLNALEVAHLSPERVMSWLRLVYSHNEEIRPNIPLEIYLHANIIQRFLLHQKKKQSYIIWVDKPDEVSVSPPNPISGLYGEEKLLTALLKRYPNAAHLYWERAHFKFGNEDYAEALSDVTTALDLNADDQMAYWLRAETRIELNDMEGARADFEQRFALTNDQLSYRADLAWLHYRAGAYAETLDLTKAVLAEQPDSFNVLITDGLALKAKNDSSNAVVSLSRALKVYPKELNKRLLRYRQEIEAYIAQHTPSDEKQS